MTWQVVARQDGARTIDTRSARVLLGLTIVAVLVAAYVYPVFAPEPITTARFSGFVVGVLATLLPIVGILLGYNAVASKRQSGSLLLTLSLPHGRDDVVLGAAVARGGLLAAAIVVAMVTGGLLVVYPFGELAIVRFLAFVLLTVAFGAIWTNLGVAVSVAVATKTRATVIAFFLLFTFVFVWDTMEATLELGVNVVPFVGDGLPAPVVFAFALAPGRVFGRVTDGFIDPSASVDGPWYLGEWIALVAFVCWLVVPLWLAHLRFERGDLA